MVDKPELSAEASRIMEQIDGVIESHAQQVSPAERSKGFWGNLMRQDPLLTSMRDYSDRPHLLAAVYLKLGILMGAGRIKSDSELLSNFLEAKSANDREEEIDDQPGKRVFPRGISF